MKAKMMMAYKENLTCIKRLVNDYLAISYSKLHISVTVAFNYCFFIILLNCL